VFRSAHPPPPPPYTRQSNFFGSLAREMITQMDFCDVVLQGWGPAFDVTKFDRDTILPLQNAAPAACGDWDPKTGVWTDKPRAAAEVGDDWTNPEETRAGAGESNFDPNPNPNRWGMTGRRPPRPRPRWPR
jgi:hypothetical protein